MDKITKRNCPAYTSHRLHDQLIDHKRLLRHHRFIARAHERSHCQFDDLVGAVAKDQLFRHDSQFLRHSGLQIKAIAIRIKMKLVEPLLNSTDSLRRRSKRIFIRRELDGIRDAVLAFDLFDGLSRRVGH